MKFPTIKEMAEEVAEKALDEYEYNGKTLREWVKIILATDTNVATKVGTNLAEVGTDCISREQAIKATWQDTGYTDPFNVMTAIRDRIQQLPPIQPKRGRWVLVCDNNGMHFICNKCGAWRYHQEQNFCGECGADMRQKGENSESN